MSVTARSVAAFHTTSVLGTSFCSWLVVACFHCGIIMIDGMFDECFLVVVGWIHCRLTGVGLQQHRVSMPQSPAIV